MARDRLKGVRDDYDVVVIGSGLAGLTAANVLAKSGHTVLLLEQHYNFGGLATWFRRKGGHVFDISLHGFPVGMIKSCRKYWTQEIADSIVQLKGIRFDNPQFQIETTFDRADFTRLLTARFGVDRATLDCFFDTARAMDFYDDQSLTTQALFDRFFPGRSDVVRLLMEPITYANGSTLDDPAITYGIVFSNFMSKGVYIFRGGTDKLIRLMKAELEKNGVDIRQSVAVERLLIADRAVRGVVANGRPIPCGAVVSNANLKTTLERLVGLEHFDDDFAQAVRAVRLNNSSCQVYLGLSKGQRIDYLGDLIFSSTAPEFDTTAMRAMPPTSRTFSMYYPDIRPGSDRYAIVSSTNANYSDWAGLSEEEYRQAKQRLIENTLDALQKYVPDIRGKLDHLEAATPRTFERYTQHAAGATFGTKFEGLAVSLDLPKQIGGLFHTGSVGIIMSGWLGTINYGVIVANEVDAFLAAQVPAQGMRNTECGRNAETPKRRNVETSKRRNVETSKRLGSERAAESSILSPHASVPRPDHSALRTPHSALLPHRPPFLFVDEVVELTPDRIVTTVRADPNADYFRGHYPDNPVMPGVLICESVFQAGAILMLERVGIEKAQGAMPVLTRIQEAKFKHIVRPGQTLTVEVVFDEELDGAYYMTGRVRVESRPVLRVSFVGMLVREVSHAG